MLLIGRSDQEDQNSRICLDMHVCTARVCFEIVVEEMGVEEKGEKKKENRKRKVILVSYM